MKILFLGFLCSSTLNFLPKNKQKIRIIPGGKKILVVKNKLIRGYLSNKLDYKDKKLNLCMYICLCKQKNLCHANTIYSLPLKNLGVEVPILCALKNSFVTLQSALQIHRFKQQWLVQQCRSYLLKNICVYKGTYIVQRSMIYVIFQKPYNVL